MNFPDSGVASRRKRRSSGRGETTHARGSTRVVNGARLHPNFEAARPARMPDHAAVAMEHRVVGLDADLPTAFDAIGDGLARSHPLGERRALSGGDEHQLELRVARIAFRREEQLRADERDVQY